MVSKKITLIIVMLFLFMVMAMNVAAAMDIGSSSIHTSVSLNIPKPSMPSSQTPTISKPSMDKSVPVVSQPLVSVLITDPVSPIITDTNQVTAFSTTSGPSIQGVSVFPGDNIWNVPIDTLPVDDRSEDYIRTMGGEDQTVKPQFYSGLKNGVPWGIPYNVVSGDQPKIDVSIYYYTESDCGPYPIPENPLIQQDHDFHLLIVDKDNAILYELYKAIQNPDGTWTAGAGAVYNLLSNTLRPVCYTSADAAGLPIFPGLVKYDEVASGEIRHAIRTTAISTQKAFVWPARHYASTITSPEYPPMGQRFRLKSSFDTSGYPYQAKVIMEAMKKYGVIVADNAGGSWDLSGTPDERWDNEALKTLRDIKGTDFEAVDVSSLMINPDSGQTS